MNLIFIRHAIAEDRAIFSQSSTKDELRPLTDEGRKKMAKISVRLKKILPAPDLIFTSPLVRASETTEVLLHDFAVPTEVSEQLKPESSPRGFPQFIKDHHPDLKTAFAVGHESQLSEMISILLTDSGRMILSLKKGGVCWVEDAFKAPQLKMLLTPKSLL